MRFPFGRGARQREIDGLRQRIAELQDDITSLDQTLTAEAPDVETTDAYRSVQLLRESMRREELTTLRQELAGLEARLETLTIDRHPSTPGTSINPPMNATSVEAAVPGAATDPATAESRATSVAGEAGPSGAGEAEPSTAPSPVSGRGLPSERAIIEPPLPPAPGMEAVAPVAEPVGSPVPDAEEPFDAPVFSAEEPVEAFVAGAEAQPALIADEAAAAETAETPILDEQEAVAGVAAVEEPVNEPVGEVPVGSAGATEVQTSTEAGPVEQAAAQDDEPQAAAGPTDAAETTEPAATAGTSTFVSDEEAVAAPAEPEGEADAVEREDVVVAEREEAVEPPRRPRSGARVAILLLVLLAAAGVVAVAAFESGMIAPGFITAARTVGPTSPPTLPATVAPTRPPPTLVPTPPPTAAPQPTVAPIAALTDDAATDDLSATEAIEAAIDRGVIAAPVGFTGALLREGPVTSARNVEFLPNGVPVDILDGSAIGSGFRWLRVRSAQGAIGWVISSVLGR